MASFSDLPTELVLEIVGHVLPQEIQRFCIASEKMLPMTLPLWKTHQRTRKRYSDFNIMHNRRFKMPKYWDNLGAFNCGQEDGFKRWLTEVLENPRVELYVQEIRLEAWFDDSDSEIPKSYPSYTAKQLSLLKRALSTIVLPEKLEMWI